MIDAPIKLDIRRQNIALGTACATVKTRAEIWLRNHRTRRHLHDLTDAQLADIGLSPAERNAECAKWFWQG